MTNKKRIIEIDEPWAAGTALAVALGLSNPIGWGILAAIGLSIGLGALFSWAGGQIHSAFSK